MAKELQLPDDRPYPFKTAEGPKRVVLRPGDTVEKVLPYSEVCMHLRVAGKRLKVRLGLNGRTAQIYDADGKPYSFPVLAGEAGLHDNYDGTFYCYPDMG